MRNNKVQAGAIEIPWFQTDPNDMTSRPWLGVIKMSFHFGPEFTPSAGRNGFDSDPSPGGWKGGTTGLDELAPFNPNSPSEPEIP